MGTRPSSLSARTLQCWCYLPTFANVGLRRNIGVYRANVALRGIHPKCCSTNARSTILLRLNHARSRQITVLHECTPNLAYIWPRCMPTMAYIQSDNHAKSRSITPNHGIRQIIDSDKPNVAKLCLHTECCSENLQLNVGKYDQHGVCGVKGERFTLPFYPSHWIGADAELRWAQRCSLEGNAPVAGKMGHAKENPHICVVRPRPEGT